MMTDPIADMLTRIRNAQMSRKGTVLIPLSKAKKTIALLLSAEGYVGRVTEHGDVKKMLEIELKYQQNKPVIQSLTRESKPGHRVYRKREELPRILNDYGIAIISTSEGLMTNKQARKRGIGGEIICSVY